MIRGYARRVLYREPFGRVLPWFMVAVGCFSVLVGLFISVSGDLNLFAGPNSVALGLFFVFGGLSDLLPGERRTAITLLRVGVLLLLPVVLILAVANIAAEMMRA